MARSKITIEEVVSQFLVAQKTQGAVTTYDWYKGFLLPFARQHGHSPVASLTGSAVHDWVSTYPGASQHGAARAVVRALNWAVAERLILRSPLIGFRKPPPTRREFSVTPAQYAACLKAATVSKRVDGIWTQTNLAIRDVIKFLYHTGCRPQELRIIEAQWISGQKIVIPKELSKGKRKSRVIYLDGMAQNIAARLSKEWPDGAIFRNSVGNPWTNGGLGSAFRQLGKHAGIPGLIAYGFRHARITLWLESGMDVATVAALAGNSARMVLDVYNHVAQNEDRLLAQLD
jgi:integrase